MTKCPYCDQEMKSKHPPFYLSPKQKELFQFVLSAGDDGVDADTIMSELEFKSPITLRTKINAINKQIAPMRLRSRGAHYRLIKPEITNGKDN